MRWAPPIAALALLGRLVWRGDLALTPYRLESLRAPWLALTAAASVPPMLLSAWRWRFTAGRLKIDVPWGLAWREYYVSALLNQVLPSGVLGDVTRVVRHGRSLQGAAGAHAAAATAVVFERVSNLAVVWGCALALAPRWVERGVRAWGAGPLAACALAPLAAVAAFTVMGSGAARRRAGRAARAAWDDGSRVFVRRGAGFIHLTVSALVFVLFGTMFWCASAAVGVPLDAGRAVRIVPLVLVASSVPITPAGWGVREMASAALYGAEGLPPPAGAAASLVYGAVSIAATLPGLVFLAAPRPRGRD
jgi:uncharacterized membrane protein YbhN (UPF0104 family)